jgi:transposase-like protein
MEIEKKENQISAYFEQTDENFSYEIAFKRWLVFEIETKKMTAKEASESFNISLRVIYHWREKYSSQMVLPLPDMTVQEKQELESLQKQLKEAEKRLEQASMQNIALNMLIDVAEEKLKINIRKKPGAKQ